MILAVSPLLNPLAPKASPLVGGDPAAFGLVLAEMGGATIEPRPPAPSGGVISLAMSPPLPADPQLLADGEDRAEARPPTPFVPPTMPAAPPKRHVAVPTGKTVPPKADPVPPSEARGAADVVDRDEEEAFVSSVPVAIAIASPDAPATLIEVADWPRLTQPETCASPAPGADQAITAQEPSAADPLQQGPPIPSTRLASSPAIDSASDKATPVQAFVLDRTHAPSLSRRPAVIDGSTEPASPSTAIAPDRNGRSARPVADEPRPAHGPLPKAASIPALVQGPMVTPAPAPIAAMLDPAIHASRPEVGGIMVRPSIPFDGTDPAPRPPSTVRTLNAAPTDSAATARSEQPAVAPERVAAVLLSALTGRRVEWPAAALAGLTHERMPIVASAPSSTRESVDTAFKTMPIPPPRFTSSLFRPLPEIDTPTASPIAEVLGRAGPMAAMVSVVSASTTPAAPVAGQAAPAVAGPTPAVTIPPEGSPETVASPTDLRPDTPNPTGSEGARAASPSNATEAPALVATRTIMSGSARQVFAADLRRPARDPRPIAGEPLAAPIEASRLDPASATATVPIDMRQDRWPSAMVDRIERLRDAADAADTRIRLVPDALGSIEVSVKRDGDTVHVHFTAEQAATRALLGEAAPRLAEAAETRGLKLGQTVAGDGGSQPNGRQPQPNSTPVPARPRSAATADEDAADTRIA